MKAMNKVLSLAGADSSDTHHRRYPLCLSCTVASDNAHCRYAQVGNGFNARDGNRTHTPLAGLRILSLDQKTVSYEETLT